MTQPQPPQAIHVAVCLPLGRDLTPVVPNESRKRSLLTPLSFEDRPVICTEFVLAGDEYARARNGLVQDIIGFEKQWGIRFDYLFWADDDVVLPPDVIPRLLQHKLPIVSGLYIMRKPPYLPVAYQESKDPKYRGRFWNIECNPANDELIEVDATGQGCVLVRRDVYDAITPPWFAWWPVYRDGENTYQLGAADPLPTEAAVPVRPPDPVGKGTVIEDRTLGEDLYFFTKARQAGFRVFLDTGVKCGHEGRFVYTHEMYLQNQPRYRKIAPEGRLAILFLAAPSPKQWDGNTLRNEPLGGSESAVGYLAETLANEHHHVVYVASGAAMNEINNVHYRPYEMTPLLISQPWDVVVVSRWVDVLSQAAANPQIKRVIFWAHDIIPLVTLREIYKHANAVVAISPFHSQITHLHNDPGMTETIMPNGVDMGLFEHLHPERKPGKMLWTSNPNRGLPTAVRILRRLRARWPELELHVYGRSAVYGWNSATDPQHEGPYLPDPDEPNVFLHDPLNKADLAKELATAWAWFYPTTWPETFSIAALEAQAAGTPVICNAYAALADTVRGGVFAPLSRPGFDFEAAVEKLMDPREWEFASMKGREWAREHDWTAVGNAWEELLRAELARQPV